MIRIKGIRDTNRLCVPEAVCVILIGVGYEVFPRASRIYETIHRPALELIPPFVKLQRLESNIAESDFFPRKQYGQAQIFAYHRDQEM